MKTLRRLLAVLFFGAAFWAAYRLAGANDAEVSVDLLFRRTPPAELWIVLVVAMGLGAGLASLLLLFEVARLGLLSRRYRKTVGRLETEIHQLRNLPIEGDDAAPAGFTAAAGGSTPRAPTHAGPIG